MAIFPLSVHFDTATPLRLLFLAVAAGFVALHLHLYRTSARVEVGIIVVLGAFAMTDARLNRSTHEIAAGTLVVVLFAAWATVAASDLYVSLYERQDERFRAPGALMTCAIALLGTIGALTLWLFVAAAPTSIVYGQPEVIQSWLLVVAAVGAGAAIMSACIAGLITAGALQNRDVAMLLQLSHAPPALQFGLPRRPTAADRRDAIERLAFAVRVFMFRASVVALRTLQAAANLLRRAAHLAANAVKRVSNYLHRKLVLLLRRLRATVGLSVRCILDACLLTVSAGSTAGRLVVLPTIALGSTVLILVAAGRRELSFLIDGSYSALGMVILAAAFAYVLLTVAWVAVVQEAAQDALHAAARSASISAPNLLLFLAVGGWIVGLPGSLGHGQIHVGVVTVASSLALVAAYLWTRFGRDTAAPPD